MPRAVSRPKIGNRQERKGTQFKGGYKHKNKSQQKISYFHTMECYIAIKSNEALTHAATWRNFKSLMLTERRQTQEAVYCLIPFI